METATYESDFVAAKTATELTKAYMFCDNKAVVTSSTIPQSILYKRHNMLSYHRVREAIAAKILNSTGVHLIKMEMTLLANIGRCKSQEYNKRILDYQGDITLPKPD